MNQTPAIYIEVMMKRFVILLGVFLPALALGATANVSVDYNTDINSFSPAGAFAINAGQYDAYSRLRNNVWQFQHAGFRYIRFPGGSNSNEYHWNGDGSYDSENVWHVAGSPNPTTFSRGFMNLALYRGSTSAGYGKEAFITDAGLSTSWKSFAGETAPQWVYLNIQTPSYQPVTFNRVVIEWGTPYAAQYKIQYSNANWPGALDVWAYNDTAWNDTSIGTISGSGGQADHTFTSVTAKYVRILCLVPYSGTQYEIKDIKVYDGVSQVSVNSDDAKIQTKSVASSMSHGDEPHYYDNMDFEQFMSVCQSLTPPAQPLITVNFFTGTTQEAKDWVEYANNYKGYGIKYWEIGNECAGNWEAGGPAGPEFYGKRFIDFYDAMTAADPSITVMPQFNMATDPWNITCTANNPGASDYYIESFLKYLQAQGRLGIIKAISIHRYPTFQPASEATVLGQTEIWDTELVPLNNWINTYCGGPQNTSIWLTEYNDGIDSAFTNRYYNSLFISSYLLSYMKNGGDFGFYFTDFGTPGPGQYDPSIYSDFGAMEGGALTGDYLQFKYQPRSSYWAMWMLSNRFSAEDSFGNTLVAANSSLGTIKAFANKRGDRKLSVILINTSSADAADVSLLLTGFSPEASADVTTFSPQQYSWIEDGYDSHADPDNQPVDSVITGVSSSFSVNVPAYNIKVITMYDSTRPTLIPSSTPTMLPTVTYTPTPPFEGGVLVDNCDDGDIQNLWGGTWSTYGDGVSDYYPLAMNVMVCDGGALGSSCYAKVTGTVAASSWGFGLNCPLNSTWAPMDITMYDGVDFYFKGEPSQKRIIFSASSTQGDYAHYGYDFTSNTFWTRYTIPFSSLTQPSWLQTPVTWTGTDIQALQFQIQHDGGYEEMCIDQISFYAFTATPTMTETPAPTFTITMTPAPATATPTPVKTAAENLENVFVYPSFYTEESIQEGIVFYNLTAQVFVRIFSLTGALVYSVHAETPQGEFLWRIKGTRKAEEIPPGVYIYIISNDSGEVKKGKVAVVR